MVVLFSLWSHILLLLLSRRVSSVKYLAGCVAYVYIHKQHRTKLNTRPVRCVWVGYPPNKWGYKWYILSSRKYFVNMEVTFHEHVSFFTRPQLQRESSNLECGLSFFSLIPALLSHLFLGKLLLSHCWFCPSATYFWFYSRFTKFWATWLCHLVLASSLFCLVLLELTPLAPVKNKLSEPTLTYWRRGKPNWPRNNFNCLNWR